MSEPATKVVVVHRRTPEGWRSLAPELKDWKREADSLEQARQLAEDGVRWALNSDEVEVEHQVQEARHPRENQAREAFDRQMNEAPEATDRQIDRAREAIDQHRDARESG